MVQLTVKVHVELQHLYRQAEKVRLAHKSQEFSALTEQRCTLQEKTGLVKPRTISNGIRRLIVQEMWFNGSKGADI